VYGRPKTVTALNNQQLQRSNGWQFCESKTDIKYGTKINRRRGSSVSTVFDYRLDDWGSTPAETKDFSSSLCVQTSSEAHPASYPMGTEVLSRGVKRGRGVTLTTHLHLVPKSILSKGYISSPLVVSMA
jgi:hypothetical protein